MELQLNKEIGMVAKYSISTKHKKISAILLIMLVGFLLTLAINTRPATAYWGNSVITMDGYCRYRFGSEAYYRWDFKNIANCRDRTWWGWRNVSINISDACKWKYGSRAVGVWMNGTPQCWIP